MEQTSPASCVLDRFQGAVDGLNRRKSAADFRRRVCCEGVFRRLLQGVQTFGGLNIESIPAQRNKTAFVCGEQIRNERKRDQNTQRERHPPQHCGRRWQGFPRESARPPKPPRPTLSR